MVDEIVEEGWIIEYPYFKGVAYLEWAMGWNRTRQLHHAFLFGSMEAAQMCVNGIEVFRKRDGLKIVRVRRTKKATRRIKEGDGDAKQ